MSADMVQMDIGNSPSVSVAASPAQAETADAVNFIVLRKALDMQESGAMQLLNALPQPPALATEGSVGRNLNVYA